MIRAKPQTGPGRYDVHTLGRSAKHIRVLSDQRGTLPEAVLKYVALLQKHQYDVSSSQEAFLCSAIVLFPSGCGISPATVS